MYLHSLATALPPHAYSQKDCAEIIRRSPVRATLSRRSLLTLQAILRGDSGVSTRYFAMPEIEGIFDLTPDQLNEGFRREAPKLATAALRRALEQAELSPAALDALLICTCTGYLCPGVSSYVAEQLDLRPNAFLQDLAGLGCGAAIPTLRAAEALLARQPRALIATVAVEVCSAAFYLDDDPGVLVSACLFGDGAAAVLWTGEPRATAWRCRDFNTLHQPRHRDKIRFEQRQGKLRNLLDASVPTLAAETVERLFHEESAHPRPIERIVSHGGGRDVLDALSAVLPSYDFAVSREVLREYGNMSSPSVLFALERLLREGPPSSGKDWWLVAFGAGFSAHSCRLGADPA